MIATMPLGAATRKPIESWSKPGVSFEQYRSDAIACAERGYYLDIAHTDDAKAFVRGSRELDDAMQSAATAAPNADPVDDAVRRANEYERIRRSVEPERRIGHLKTVLQSAVDGCLRERGYAKFTLTASQRRRLGKMPIGSPQRRTYLYELARSPATVETSPNPMPLR
ncbi:MAG: hypothetical protein WC804_02240 [Sphingomonas sp.]|jgi:hypothetical protein|uniref:hypothetical protein n=1 Tax=Sphingomonas sp. TaxID=28214 RepID=UPI003566BC31